MSIFAGMRATRCVPFELAELFRFNTSPILELRFEASTKGCPSGKGLVPLTLGALCAAIQLIVPRFPIIVARGNNRIRFCSVEETAHTNSERAHRENLSPPLHLGFKKSFQSAAALHSKGCPSLSSIGPIPSATTNLFLYSPHTERVITHVCFAADHCQGNIFAERRQSSQAQRAKLVPCPRLFHCLREFAFKV